MADMQTKTPPVEGLGNFGTDKALDVMMKILPDVAKILNDPSADDVLKKVRGDGMKNMEAGDAFNALLPLFAKQYRPQLYRIAAACQGVTEEQVREQPLVKTTAMLANSLRVMTGFFGCCLHMARNM